MAKAATSKINPAYVVAGVAALCGIGYAVYKSTNKNNEVVDLDNDDDAPAQAPAASTPVKPPVTNTTVTLNKNLWLKKGISGNEVKELQKLLGIAADGIFGAQTEAALLARKGTTGITLNNFASAPDVNKSALPKGTAVKGNIYPEITSYAVKKVAGGWELKAEELTTWNDGETIGKIIDYNASKTKYVIEYTFLAMTMYTWVNAGDVKKL